MKIYHWIIACCLLLPLGGCSNWLDVIPEDSVDEKDLFSTGEGYRNALNGVYRQMSQTSMYGQQMSWGFIDVLGQLYNTQKLSNYSAYGIAGKNYAYRDETVKSVIQVIWSNTYNSIANCNNIVGRITGEDPSKFRGGEAEQHMIQGEALALRAFLHFDLLRLWAPAPVTNPSGNYMPYFENYPSTYEPDKSVQEILSLVERDLLQAKNLVAPFDTLPDKSMLVAEKRIKNNWVSSSVTDLFFLYRGFRMNYYAVIAQLARVYNYMGEYEKAVHCAQEVLDAYAEEYAAVCFQLSKKEEVQNNDRKRYKEVIFALSNELNLDNYEPYYTTSSDRLVLAGYPGIFDDEADVRKEYLTETSGADRICNKYILPTNNTLEYTQTEDLIPLIRVSEMYFIQAEYLYRKGETQAAIEQLDQVRVARDCTKGRLTVSSLDDFKKILIDEARREFMQEGQLYYYFKRLNIKPLESMPDDGFVFPLPDNEVIN